MDFNSFIAEDNTFWLTWLMQYLLFNHLLELYYLHLLVLIKIVKGFTGFGMTKNELSDLGTNLYEWHLIYEE